MEAQPRTCSSASSSTAYPRWVMLEECLEIKVDSSSSSCSPTDDDTNTLAAARTSTGRPIQVSLRVAEPPALSRVRLRIPAGVRQEKSKVLAAHGDAVLIQVRLKDKDQQDYVTDHLVYKAGAAAAGDPPRPPSLSLLPPACFSSDSAGLVAPRELRHSCTGLLRRRGRGEDDDDEVVVAELTAGSLAPGVAQLYMFRSGAWSRHDVEIREDRSNLPLVSWHTVVPVDDRLLCWVDLNRGVLLCDVLAETPRAQYVRLPMDPREGGTSNRNVCATATAGGGGGGAALKFVNVFPRCCCGGAGASRCERSRHAYTVHTWMLRRRIDDGDMEWVMDGMVDATELWALDAYKGLPSAPIALPVVSTDEPEVVCFSLREPIWPVWQIMVNMRSKTIHSVSCQKHGYCDPEDKLIPSNVSRFFNASYPCSGGGDDATTLTGSQQSQVDDIERTQDSVQALSLLEMSEALEEIPSYGLLGADEVKAYRILVSRDNGRRRLRSFLGLPKGLRKDWLLMEIKASDAN